MVLIRKATALLPITKLSSVVMRQISIDHTLREKMAEVAEVWKLDTAKVRPYEEVVAQYPELAGEAKNFVRLIERESGEKTFLRIYDDMTSIYE